MFGLIVIVVLAVVLAVILAAWRLAVAESERGAATAVAWRNEIRQRAAATA